MRADDSLHSHPCTHCKTPVECHGEQARNFDGWPATICHAYHQANGTIAPFLCEACALSTRMQCDDCGEPAVRVFEDEQQDATGYRGDKALCAECLEKRQSVGR